MSRLALWFVSSCVAALLLLLAIGCGEHGSGSSGAFEKQMVRLEPPTLSASKTAASEAAPTPQAPETVANPMPRKIIYTATVEMVCTDFAAAAKRLLDEVRAKSGYVAETNVSGG